MLGRGEAVSPEEALKRIVSALPDVLPKTENVLIEDALDRIVAHEIASPEDMPPFTRSTVDGYAVDARDTFGASETAPAYIAFKGEILMAQAAPFPISRGEAARIPTGGMLPEGADAVVMLEHANETGGMLEVVKPVAPGENLIKRGEDARKGEGLISKGHCLRPQDLAALAGTGITEMALFSRPVVSIIITGDEIAPAGETELKPGFVRDMNSYTLSAMAKKAGGIAVKEGIVGDDFPLLKGAFERALSRSDMVLITGGSSVGTRDYTERLISEGGKVLFHGVAMKPGKPMLAGMVEGKPVFGLPGHPAAVAVCFDVFVKPVLRRLAGRAGSLRDRAGTVQARLSKGVGSGAGGRTQYIRVALFEKDGGLWAEPVLGPSGLIRTLVHADGVIIIPAGRPGMNRGEEAAVRIF